MYRLMNIGMVIAKNEFFAEPIKKSCSARHFCRIEQKKSLRSVGFSAVFGVVTSFTVMTYVCNH